MPGVNNSTNCILGNIAYKQDSFTTTDSGKGTGVYYFIGRGIFTNISKQYL